MLLLRSIQLLQPSIISTKPDNFATLIGIKIAKAIEDAQIQAANNQTDATKINKKSIKYFQRK